MSEFGTVKLIPVDQWVYHRWLVTYWIGNPDEGGRKFSSRELVAPDSPASYIEDEEWWPNRDCNFYTYDLIKENVPRPRVVGHLYGMPLHESGWDINTNKRY